MVAALSEPQSGGLRVEQLSKTFPGTRALAAVDLEVRRGEVHALLGANGSGKSTLIKILAGVHRGDPGGTIRMGTREVASTAITPPWARAAGLRFVHQDLGLFDALSVAENVFAGTPYPRRFGRIEWPRLRREASETLERLAVRLAPDRALAGLRPADRALVAVARALHDVDQPGGVLVLDEPTAPLPAAEVEVLLGAVRRLAAAGESILYVSHRLGEVVSVSDAVTVLRDGRRVAHRTASDLDEQTLIGDIVGRSLELLPRRVLAERTRPPELRVRSLAGGPVRNVSFELRAGQILGIGGLAGSGRTALLELIFGAHPREAGQISLGDETLTHGSPAGAIRAGLAYVPENRARDGMFAELGVPENLSAADLGRYWRGGRYHHSRERADARTDVADLHIQTPFPTAALAQLSGGNQQKVMLGRCLRRETRLLLLDEPTQGVDVASSVEIHRQVRRAVSQGAHAILVSSDFEELARISDRVLVLAGGRVIARSEHQVDPDWILDQIYRNRGDEG